MSQIKVERLTEEQKQQRNIPPQLEGNADWSVWTCEPSVFDWHYDQEESAYLYDGRVNVKTAEGITEIKAGDFVVFPRGLTCSWEVLETVRKVYCFK